MKITTYITDILIAGILSLIVVKIFPDLLQYVILACLIYIMLQEIEKKL